MDRDRISDARAWARGPLPDCNWVIPDVFLAGGCPGVCDQYHTKRRLRKLVEDNNISLFISLMEESDYSRSGMYRYRDDLLELARGTVHIEDYPIPDCNIIHDKVAWSIAQRIVHAITHESQIVYLHCVGGHGRTGTIVSLVVGILYNLTCDQALDYCRLVHSCRDTQSHPKNSGYCASSPQTPIQFDQVRRLLSTSCLPS